MTEALVLAVSADEIVQNAVEAASLGAFYALLALGVALVFGVMRLINFAHGELIMIGAFVLVATTGLPWTLQLAVTCAAVVIAALLVERTAFRPLRDASPTTLLVASFALSFGLQSLAQVVFGSEPRSVSVLPGLADSLGLGSIAVPKLSVAIVVVTGVLLVGLVAFLTRTMIGVQMRAAAEDFDMARLLGVRANRVIATAFAISGLFAGVAAVFLVSQTGTTTTTMGVSAVLFAFVATILGGMGSLPGAALGGFVLGVLTIVLQVALPLDLRVYRDAFVFALVIAVLVVRPQGLLVPRSTRTRI